MKNDLYFAYCQGDILLTSEGHIPFGDTPPVEFQPWEHVTDLAPLNPPIMGDFRAMVKTPPLYGGGWKGAVHIYRLDRPVTNREDLQMMGLRKSFEVLSPEMYQLAGKCAELVYWDQNSKFCGCCGAPMKWHTEISKHCTECGKELWPQLQTAIIVRVTRGDEVLMVHAHTFRPGYYGLVAGFVETGETLEECVRREVWEETHLRVKNIRYFASQPWPFPAGLMVGFTAEYDSGVIQLQRSELGGGGWFRRDSLPTEIPNRSSLARWLIDDWLIGNKK